MTRSLRFIPSPGILVEVTTRTVHGRLLFKPTPPINRAVLGVLGRAQRVHGMVVHLAVVLSNHYHLLLAPTDAKQLAGFMGFVNSNIAREVGRLADWSEKFWGRRYQSIVVSDEVQAQLGRLDYFLANGVKENLVESPLDWPGIHCAKALTTGHRLEGIGFDRTAFYRAKKRWKPGELLVQEHDFKTAEVLELTPLLCLEHLSETQHREYIASRIEDVVAQAAAGRQEKGMAVLGASTIQRGSIPTPSRIASRNRRRRDSIALRSQFEKACNTPIRSLLRRSGSRRQGFATAIEAHDSRKDASRQPCRSAPDEPSHSPVRQPHAGRHASTASAEPTREKLAGLIFHKIGTARCDRFPRS